MRRVHVLQSSQHALANLRDPPLVGRHDERDALWGSIRDGAVRASEVAERYEQQVRGADALADRRFDGAEAISQTDQLVTAVAKLRAAR